MRRYNIIPLILLTIPTINFALAAPVLKPEKCQVCVDVAHVPKDVAPMLGKRGDDLAKLEKLFDNFDRWWGDYEDSEIAESSSSVLPSSSSAPTAPLESSHGSMQAHVPPANPASSTASNRDPELSVSHPPTSSTASSSESDSENESIPSIPSSADWEDESIPSISSDSDSENESIPSIPSSSESDSDDESILSLEPASNLDHEEMNLDHDAPPPDSDSEDATPSSSGSHSDSALTVGNLDESSNAPATSASRGSANPMDGNF